jgi:hypothetical protein
MGLEPTTPEDVGERVTIPGRWMLGYFVLALVGEAVIIGGNWCVLHSRQRWTAGWLLLALIISVFITSPAITAALLVDDAIRRSYGGSWPRLRTRLSGALLTVLIASGAMIAGGTLLLLREFEFYLGLALPFGGATIVVSLLLGHLAALPRPQDASEARQGEYTARLAVVAIGTVGLVGALLPSIAALINACRYPDGFGGIIASLGIVPAMIASGLTWVGVQILSKWRGPIAR